MNTISAICPRCQRSLEIPRELDNVICPGCGAACWIRRRVNVVDLVEMQSGEETPLWAAEARAVIETRLAELDELMEETEVEIEILRSKEQSAPLQKGCAFFGLFVMIIIVIAIFMLLGKSYFGSWLFYATLTAVILLGLARIRRKLIGSSRVEDLRQERLRMEDALTQLEIERHRVQQLGTSLGLEG